MERHLLPGEDEAGGDAGVLRRAPADGRDQQHLLPDAEGARCSRTGRAHARGVPFRDQGIAAHHAHVAAQGRQRRRFGRLPVRNLAALGEKRGPVLFQLPPIPEEGPAAAERVPRTAARRARRRVRVPQRHLVRRRGLRRAARAPALRCASPSARTTRRRRWSRPRRGATCGCGSRSIRTRTCSDWAQRLPPPAGAKSTSTSCTSRPRRRMRRR